MVRHTLGKHRAPQQKQYRCVYCHRRIASRMDLPAHEAVCPMRASMQQLWAILIDRGVKKLG